MEAVTAAGEGPRETLRLVLALPFCQSLMPLLAVLQDLLSGAQCRKHYRKALLRVHPDQQHDKSVTDQLLAER